MYLPSNLFDNYTPMPVYLCQPDKTIIGELQVFNFDGTLKFNTYSEIQFSVARTYNDAITGKTFINPYYDLIDSIRVIYIRGVGHFIIQDIDEDLSDMDVKTVSCFSLEYAAATKYLNNFHVNTGEYDSLEYIYHIQEHGNDYSVDIAYKTAVEFDPYERYYIKEYTDTKSYVYTEVKIIDEAAFHDYDEQLYVKAFPNVRFYNPSIPELSLLHIVFSYIPEWKIGHVDPELIFQERTFSEDRIAVYDFLSDTAAETFSYVMEWDSILGVVNFYATEEDGVTEDNYIQTRWDTDVFISKDNLASQLSIKYSTDDIRTKLKISGGDDLDVRDVNLGRNHIMNLSFYNDPIWLGLDLHKKYNEYLDVLNDYTEQYTKLVSTWAAANNEYSDLMYAVPIANNVLYVGDEFKTLYCIYRPVYAEDATEAQIDAAIQASRKSLINKLNLYNVKDDTDANKSDNVLLTLEDTNSNSATIRVYYSEDGGAYSVRRTVTNASTGIVVSKEYSLSSWILEELTAETLELSGWEIKSIGTLGAYLCLVKDETVKENIEDYGIKLLQEKQSVYTKIFITQTEGYYAKEGNQCIASDEQPTGEIASGTKWLDTDSDPLKVYVFDSKKGWISDSSIDASDYANNARFVENYEKLQVVQSVLVEKELMAKYLLSGDVVTTRYFTADKINSDNLITVINEYFANDVITVIGYEKVYGLMKFTISSDEENEYAVYVGSDGHPYIAYYRSQGVCLAKMNYINSVSSMENYFTEGELIRLSPFLREDEYSNANIILTGYESEEEEITIKQTLLEEATKELKKICQPKLSFDIDMANIMAIPEFAPLQNQFQLGNFVKVEIRPGYVKRARLLEIHLNFDDLSDFSCTFGDLVTTQDEVDKTADLLQQAVQAGKTVAASSSSWQKAVEKSTALDQAIQDGLKDAALSIGSVSGQSITWDEKGILGRKRIEGTTNMYDDEQFLLSNNKLLFTSDGWNTSKGVFGKFTIEKDGRVVDMYGILTDAMVGGYIQGSEIKGGTLEIGGDGGMFKVHSDGSVEILDASGNSAYATVGDFEQVAGWRTEVVSMGSTIFTDRSQYATLVCKVYNQGEDKTNEIDASNFNWYRTSTDSTSDVEWNKKHKGYKNINITHEDVRGNASFYCEVNIETT